MTAQYIIFILAVAHIGIFMVSIAVAGLNPNNPRAILPLPEKWLNTLYLAFNASVFLVAHTIFVASKGGELPLVVSLAGLAVFVAVVLCERLVARVRAQNAVLCSILAKLFSLIIVILILAQKSGVSVFAYILAALCLVLTLLSCVLSLQRR